MAGSYFIYRLMNNSLRNYAYKKRTIRRKLRLLKYSVVALGILVAVLSSMIIFSEENKPHPNPNQYEDIIKEIETINGELDSMNSIEDSLHQIATNSNVDVNQIEENRDAKDYTDYQNHVATIMNILNEIENKIDKKSRYYHEIISSINEKKRIMKSMPSIMPISPDECIAGSGYGKRRHPIHRIVKMHKGVDLIAKRGTVIRATASGVVTKSGGRSGYGIMVRIDHGEGYETLYAHLSSVLVSEGDIIKKGDVIGLVGSTGLSTGPHLHYEVIKNGRNVDPMNYFFNDLTPQEYDEMIAIFNSAEMSLD